VRAGSEESSRERYEITTHEEIWVKVTILDHLMDYIIAVVHLKKGNLEEMVRGTLTPYHTCSYIH
jgi:hypothetical protein